MLRAAQAKCLCHLRHRQKMPGLRGVRQAAEGLQPAHQNRVATMSNYTIFHGDLNDSVFSGIVSWTDDSLHALRSESCVASHGGHDFEPGPLPPRLVVPPTEHLVASSEAC